MEEYGPKKWSLIATKLKTKGSKQVKSVRITLRLGGLPSCCYPPAAFFGAPSDTPILACSAGGVGRTTSMQSSSKEAGPQRCAHMSMWGRGCGRLQRHVDMPQGGFGPG